MCVFSYIIRKIEVIPASRLQSIRGSELARSTEATRHTGPCGGFSTQYACMCDLHGVPYREEVAWVRLNRVACASSFLTQPELPAAKSLLRETRISGRGHDIPVARHERAESARLRSFGSEGLGTDHLGSGIQHVVHKIEGFPP